MAGIVGGIWTISSAALDFVDVVHWKPGGIFILGGRYKAGTYLCVTDNHVKTLVVKESSSELESQVIFLFDMGREWHEWPPSMRESG